MPLYKFFDILKLAVALVIIVVASGLSSTSVPHVDEEKIDVDELSTVDVVKNKELARQMKELDLIESYRVLKNGGTFGKTTKKTKENSRFINFRSKKASEELNLSLGSTILGGNGLCVVETPDVVDSGTFLVNLSFIYRYVKLPPLDSETEEIKLTDRAVNHSVIFSLRPWLQFDLGSFGDYHYSSPATYAGVKVKLLDFRKMAFSLGARRFDFENTQMSDLWQYYGYLKFKMQNSNFYLNVVYDDNTESVLLKGGLAYTFNAEGGRVNILTFESSQNEDAIFSKYLVGFRTVSQKGYSITLGVQRDSSRSEWLYMLSSGFVFR